MAEKRIITHVGKKRLALSALKNQSPALQLHVFANDASVSASSTANDFAPPSLPNYAPRSMPFDDWSEPLLSITGKAEMTHSEQQFAHFDAAAQKIYGYFVTDETDGAVIWLQKYSTPLAIEGTGAFAITPALTFAS